VRLASKPPSDAANNRTPAIEVLKAEAHGLAEGTPIPIIRNAGDTKTPLPISLGK
jgi:hypothetical protein